MQKNKQKLVFGKLFFIIWATFCTTVFIFFSGRVSVLHGSYLFNWEAIAPKLSRIEPLSFLTNILGALIGVALFSLACISLGAVFTSLFWDEKKDNFLSRPARPILIGSAFLIGSGIFSAIFLILGGLYKLLPFYIVSILLAGLVLGVRSFIKLIKIHSENHSFNLFKETRNSDRLVYWLSLGILLLSLMYSSSRLSYDSVALYFSDAKITAMTNHIQFFLNDSFIASSFHTGIQYAAIIQIFGDQAARMYSWVNGLIIIIFTLALAEQVGLSKQARRILLVLLLTTTAFTDLLGDGKIDLATSAPAIAAVYWMIKSGIKARNRSFFLVGFLAGFAIISRPFNAFLLGIFFALFYLQQIYFLRKEDGFNLKHLFKPFLWLTSAFLALAVFHLVANWMILGDPLAPLSNASKLSTSVWQWSFDANEIWIFRALYPFVLTFINSPQSLGTITPLFLAFFPGIFMKEIREKLFTQKSLVYLTTMAIITLFLWIMFFFTIVEIRYVFFLWIILFMPLAVIAEKVLILRDNTGKIMELMLIVVLLFVNFRIVYISLDTYSPINAQGNPQCSNNLFCDFLKPINDNAVMGERVLTMNAYRYYLRSDLFACSTKADEYSAMRNASLKSPDNFWEEVYRQGYKYLAYENNYSVRHLYMDMIPSPNNTPDWLSLKPIYGKPGDPVIAYEIQVQNPPIESEFSCQKTEAGIWEVQSLIGSKK
jgi:hypothetical protein